MRILRTEFELHIPLQIAIKIGMKIHVNLQFPCRDKSVELIAV